MDDKNILIYGRHPIADAIRAGKAFEKVMIQQGLRGEAEIEIRHLTKAHGIPLSIVPREKLSKMAGGNQANHQGFLGFLALVEYQKLDEVLPFIYEKGENPLLLILDSVTDVRNFGAIARSAEVMGVQAIVVPLQGAALLNGDAMKTSAGALSRLNICREKTLSAVLDYLAQAGVQVVASDLKAEKKVFDIDFTMPTAILMGSEGEGINPALLRRADEKFIIPQVGTTDSLNVSVATGVILYEALRQRLGT
jgi:23S rRNA (guanosine2251-2'-O)-methyltransferase